MSLTNYKKLYQYSCITYNLLYIGYSSGIIMSDIFIPYRLIGSIRLRFQRERGSCWDLGCHKLNTVKNALPLTTTVFKWAYSQFVVFAYHILQKQQRKEVGWRFASSFVVLDRFVNYDKSLLTRWERPQFMLIKDIKWILWANWCMFAGLPFYVVTSSSLVMLKLSTFQRLASAMCESMWFFIFNGWLLFNNIV